MIQFGRMAGVGRVLISAAIALAGCAAVQTSSPATSGVAITPTPAQTVADVMSQPTIEGQFAIGSDQHELTLRCFGTGSPTLVFEAGDDASGIVSFPSSLVRPLAETNMTCFYDRLGTGSSDAATQPRRTLNDVVADTHALLAAANVPPPYVLIGQSGGGNIAVWYAIKHTEEVVGLVLIEAGHDDPTALAKEFGPFDPAKVGSEHIDWVNAARLEWHLPNLGDLPVLTMFGDHGQSGPDPLPSDWKKLSTDTREVVLPGGHDLQQEIPEQVADQIRSLLDAL
jgi:pimeloyl-ACP methyl ester carboxylesterase